MAQAAKMTLDGEIPFVTADRSRVSLDVIRPILANAEAIGLEYHPPVISAGVSYISFNRSADVHDVFDEPLERRRLEESMREIGFVPLSESSFATVSDCCEERHPRVCLMPATYKGIRRRAPVF